MTNEIEARVGVERLLERVRQATEPDRELDEALMALFYAREERHIGAVMEYSDGSEERVKDLVWVDPKTDRWVSTAAYMFTGSVDAALALVERVAGEDRALEMLAEVAQAISDDTVNGSLKGLPLAIIADFLTALISQKATP